MRVFPSLLGVLTFLSRIDDGSASTLVDEPEVPGFVHQVFGIEDGLPRGGINQILQTRDGNLWLATFDGLARFDGVRFEIFDSDRIPALGSNRLQRLTQTRDGALWIVSEQGHLTRFEKGHFSACDLPRNGSAACGLAEGRSFYRHVVEDAQGNVWVGSKAGLFRYQAGALLEETSIENPGTVRAIYPAASGPLWVGADRGLWVRPGDGDRFSFVGGGSQVTSLAEDRDGVLWVGTTEGVGRLVEGRLHEEIGEMGWVARDAVGSVWISLLHRLLRVEGGEAMLVQQSPRGVAYRLGASQSPDPSGSAWASWSDRLLRDGEPVLRDETDGWSVSIVVDAGGTVWAASERPGELHAFHPRRLTTFQRGLPTRSVLPLFEDTDGTLWAGAGSFLASLEPGAEAFGVRQVPSMPETGAARFVRSLLRDSSGTFWVGLSNGRFALEGDRFLGPYPPTTADILAMLEDREGILWIGSSEGLLGWDRRRESWIEVPSPGDTTRIRVRVLHEDPRGHLWLGTDGYGVMRYEKATGRFLHIDRSRGLSSDLVRALWQAPDGRLWIGTENRGLNRLDPDSLEDLDGLEIDRIGREQGLVSSGIHRMLADGLGNLWMSSNDGIFRARIADLDAVADGRLPRLETVVYDERDGMRNREANGGVQQAGLRDRQGRLWFPTQEGLVRIEPAELLKPTPPPPLQVGGVWVGEERISGQLEGVRLEPEQRSFRVTWAAPYFRAPDRLRFRYRLRPFDQEWLDAGNRREAFYTRVPPGRYTFEVTVGLEGVWSDAGGELPATLQIEVVPRFYETRAFLIATVLAAVFLLFLAFLLWDRRRQARQRSRELELEVIVRERTATIREQSERLLEMDGLRAQFFANVSHELRTPLTLILGPARDALRGVFGAIGRLPVSQIALIEKNAQRLLALVDQLLQIARLDAGRFTLTLRRLDLVEHVRRRVEDLVPLAERLGVHLETRLPTAPLPWSFDPVELAKVFDNLLSNALKLSPAGGTVRVSLTVQDDADSGREVRVEVEDEGPGVPADQLERIFDRFQQGTGRDPKPGFGLGLALARQLTELHEGRLTVSSPPGRGACFAVSLPDRGAEGIVVEEGATAARPREPELPEVEPAPAPSGEDPRARSDSEPAEETAERPTLLVVDDNADIRGYLRRHLERRYAVTEAADGLEALALARRLLPDLVISDVMMPGLDGQDLARSLRRDSRLMLVPVILVTAKASEESRLAALREGVDDYLIKPFDPRELTARVENLLTVRRRLLEHIRPPKAPLRVSEVEVTPADEAFLERVSRLVEENLGDCDLSVAGLAGRMGCDRSYLLRKLRRLTGESPSELIRSFRLQRAEQLLRARAGAVTDVAYAVGFKTVPHFSNAFLDRFGQRPSALVERLSPGE